MTLTAVHTPEVTYEAAIWDARAELDVGLGIVGRALGRAGVWRRLWK